MKQKQNYKAVNGSDYREVETGAPVRCIHSLAGYHPAQLLLHKQVLPENSVDGACQPIDGRGASCSY